jgi:hypothetical protein
MVSEAGMFAIESNTRKLRPGPANLLGGAEANKPSHSLATKQAKGSKAKTSAVLAPAARNVDNKFSQTSAKLPSGDHTFLCAGYPLTVTRHADSAESVERKASMTPLHPPDALKPMTQVEGDISTTVLPSPYPLKFTKQVQGYKRDPSRTVLPEPGDTAKDVERKVRQHLGALKEMLVDEQEWPSICSAVTKRERDMVFEVSRLTEYLEMSQHMARSRGKKGSTPNIAAQADDKMYDKRIRVESWVENVA